VRWKIGSASSQSNGGDHEVSILMATVVAEGPVVRLAARREGLDDAHAATAAWTGM
jgi:hypothetical protein